jgi:exosortase
MTNGLAARLATFAAVVLVVTAVNYGTLSQLVRYGLDESSASHSVIAPAIAAGLLFYRRREIFARVETSWAGLGVMVIGVVLMFMVAGGGPYHPSLLAKPVAPVVVLWMGSFLLIFGTQAFRKAGFAMAFLLFTMPFPPSVLAVMVDVLKRGSAATVAMLFSVTGTPVHREGYIFTLTTLSIEIADACSGIRSSIALGLTALISGHMLLKKWSNRTLLLLAVLPITIFKNGIRIVGLSLLAVYVDPSFLMGRLHTDGGVVFFLLALVMFAPVLSWFESRERRRAGGRSAMPQPAVEGGR